MRQYLAEDELLIGRDFWNFVARPADGYDTIIGAYRESEHLIREALDDIKTL